MRIVCSATGLLGENIGLIFPNPGWFADYFTGYYTDVEPKSALVVEDGGKIVGYLLGCTDQKRCRNYQLSLLGKALPPVLAGICKGDYAPAARRFFRWLTWRAWREVPRTPPNGAHFHFNMLKQWRNASTTYNLVDSFIRLLRKEHPGIRVVWGQMETFGTKRSRTLFRRLGWEFYDQKKFTKYKYLFGASPPPNLKKIDPEQVYLTTIYRHLF